MKFKNTLALIAVVFTTVACGSKIPSAYQGNFADSKAGVKLALTDSKATMTFSDGRVLTGDAADLKYADLLAGKAGVFVRANAADASEQDVFWVNPNVATKQAQEGMVWYTSEVIYTLMNVQAKDKVPNIQFFHCLDGQILLDSTNQSFQLGCPAGPDNYNAVRVGN